jgi:prolipoprotein diacylglyceryltransferase
MERGKPNLSMAIGAAIGAVLAAVLHNFLIAFEPGGFTADAVSDVGLIMIVIGMVLGASLGWVFSRYKARR